MSHLRPRRRTLAFTAIASAAALTLLAGCSAGGDSASGDDAALTPLVLQTSWIPIVQFGGSYVADAEGYYADNGVDVEILPGGPDVDPLAAVAAGQADIAMSNADNVARANAEGADLVIIAAGFQKNPLSILSSPDNPIETPDDMEGKKIGVPAGDDAAHNALVDANGLDASAVEVVPVGFDVAPLTSGEVDGLWVFYTEQPIAYEEATGTEGVVMLGADYGLDVYAQVYVVPRASLEDDTTRSSIEGFLRGEILGWQNFVADPTLAVDLTVNEYAADSGLTEEQQMIQAERQMDILISADTDANGLLWMSDEGIENNLATIESLGIEGIDASMFDTSLLTDVYDGASSLE